MYGRPWDLSCCESGLQVEQGVGPKELLLALRKWRGQSPTCPKARNERRNQKSDGQQTRLKDIIVLSCRPRWVGRALD